MATPITAEIAHNLLPKRPDAGHKGTFGHVFVLAGSRGFTGAAKLCAAAASRSGAGLVTAGVPRSIEEIVAAGALETMTFGLPANEQDTVNVSAVEPALAFANDKSAVVLGPGLSQHPQARDFVLKFVERCALPLLIDADGLNALSTDPAPLSKRESATVLTPHPGEMARLVGESTADVQANRSQHAKEFARAHRCVVVLKGHETVVASPGGDIFVNTTGNAGMACGGTGDVLSGVIGALLGQGMDPTDAAILGVYAHGAAGDFAASHKTQRGMTAVDVIASLPEAWQFLEKSA